MRISLLTDETNERFDDEFKVIPWGEYGVTADICLAGTTSKGTSKLSIPFQVVGAIYPVDIDGVLPSEIMIDGKRVIGPSDFAGVKFWSNYYLSNFFLMSGITAGNVSNLTSGQQKNGQIVAKELTTLGLPDATDPDDPFAYVNLPMSSEEATQLIASYLTEQWREYPPSFRVRTEIETYGPENTQYVRIKQMKRYQVLDTPNDGYNQDSTDSVSYIPF